MLDVPPARRDAILRAADALRPLRTVALSTHINADGDAAGSVTAMALLVAQLGIAARVVLPTPWPAPFAFLRSTAIDDRTAQGAAAFRGIDGLVVLDLSDIRRLGALADAARAVTGPRIVIDHHEPGTEPPGDLLVDDTSACATGELLFDVAAVLGLTITPAIAEALYVAILTDTGGFRFANTSPRALRIAAALLERGVDPEVMYRRIYGSVPLGRVQLLRDALASLGHDAEHGISWISLEAGALERHEVTGEDLDGIVEHPRSIAGTRLALFFRDLGYGKVKVSFRSTGDVDVHRFAATFGGGGHAKASGALIPGGLDAVRTRVLDDARAYVGPLPSAGGR